MMKIFYLPGLVLLSGPIIKASGTLPIEPKPGTVISPSVLVKTAIYSLNLPVILIRTNLIFKLIPL